MVSLGQLFFDGTILPNVTEYCAVSMRTTIINLIEDESGFAAVLEDNGRIIGGIGGLLVPLYFNYNRLAGQQVFWFVHPAYRSAKSLKLLDLWCEWCEDAGTEIIWSGAKYDHNYEGMARLMGRRGFTALESVYMKGV